MIKLSKHTKDFFISIFFKSTWVQWFSLLSFLTLPFFFLFFLPSPLLRPFSLLGWAQFIGVELHHNFHNSPPPHPKSSTFPILWNYILIQSCPVEIESTRSSKILCLVESSIYDFVELSVYGHIPRSRLPTTISCSYNMKIFK